jgi:O-methyltransferase
MDTLEYLLQDRRMMAQGRPWNLMTLLQEVIDNKIDGDVVELGCYEGRAGALMQYLIQPWTGLAKNLFMFDSFEGLPAPAEADGSGALVKEGAFAVDETTVLKTFSDLNLEIPIICKGWFCDTLPTQLPEKICFAYFDGDLYQSIKDSLIHVYPRMSPGAIGLIDDYDLRKKKEPDVLAFPGVKKACDEFLMDKPEKLEPLNGGQVYFRKVALQSE